MKSESHAKLFKKVYRMMSDETYKEIFEEIFNLAKEGHTSLYDAFRQVMWQEGRDIMVRLERKYKEIRRTELTHYSEEEKRYLIDDDEYRHLHNEVQERLEDLFDEIVKKECSEDLEKKILKDQQKFYEEWKQNREDDVKMYQKHKDEFMIKQMEVSIQKLKKDCESIRQGVKIDNKRFASAFIFQKESELLDQRLKINPQHDISFVKLEKLAIEAKKNLEQEFPNHRTKKTQGLPFNKFPLDDFLDRLNKKKISSELFKKFKSFKGKGSYTPFGFFPHIHFSSDSKTLYTIVEDKEIKELDINTGLIKATRIVMDKKDNNIISFAMSRDNRFILTCAFEDPLKLWDKMLGEIKCEFYQKDTLLNVELSSDDKYIAACGEGDFLYVWDLNSGNLLAEIESGGFSSIAISSDNQYIIGANRNYEIVMCKIENGQIIRKFGVDKSEIVFISFTPDCKKIISVSQDSTVKVWDMNKGEILKEFQIYDPNLKTEDDIIIAAILTPDGKYICIPTDEFLEIWELATGILIQRISFGIIYVIGNAFFSFAFSQDGNYLAMSDADTIYLWEKSVNYH